jgi:hypothetical protein
MFSTLKGNMKLYLLFISSEEKKSFLFKNKNQEVSWTCIVNSYLKRAAVVGF